jgi:hypothetical protein
MKEISIRITDAIKDSIERDQSNCSITFSINEVKEQELIDALDMINVKSDIETTDDLYCVKMEWIN